MKIYIDSNCKCHTTNPDGIFREFDLEFFDDKCQTFVEGHRYCPKGESYTSDKGEVFHGECIVLWKSYSETYNAQREYEREKLADAENALAILFGGEST